MPCRSEFWSCCGPSRCWTHLAGSSRSGWRWWRLTYHQCTTLHALGQSQRLGFQASRGRTGLFGRRRSRLVKDFSGRLFDWGWFDCEVHVRQTVGSTDRRRGWRRWSLGCSGSLHTRYRYLSPGYLWGLQYRPVDDSRFDVRRWRDSRFGHYSRHRGRRSGQ